MAEIGSTNPPGPTWPIRPVRDSRQPPRRQPKKEQEEKDKPARRDEDDDKPHIDEYA